MPCSTTRTPPGWQIYVNREFRFCVDYPTTYQFQSEPARPVPGGWRVVDTLKLAHPRDSDPESAASIEFIFIRKPFNDRDIAGLAPTGQEDLPVVLKRFGSHRFAMYGPGGGGVDYSDQFITELNGKILNIVFSGPYDGDKSPNAATQKIEPLIVSSFRRF